MKAPARQPRAITPTAEPTIDHRDRVAARVFLMLDATAEDLLKLRNELIGHVEAGSDREMAAEEIRLVRSASQLARRCRRTADAMWDASMPGIRAAHDDENLSATANASARWPVPVSNIANLTEAHDEPWLDLAPKLAQVKS